MNFVDLHLHSTYSNLDAFGTPTQIVKRAKDIGRKALALTDHGSVSGIVQLMQACKEHGLKPIYGCEFYIVDSLPKMFEEKQRQKNHITVLAADLAGYKNLLKLISLAYSKGFYYRPTIDEQLLFENNTGLNILSGCWSGKIHSALRDGDVKSARIVADRYREAIGNRYFLETQHFPLFKVTIDNLKYISECTKIPMVLTCDPHYLTEEQASVQEILHAIRDRRTFDKDQIIYGAFQWPAEDLMEAVKTLFPKCNWEEMFANTCLVAETCNVDMPLGSIPVYPMSNGLSPSEHLQQLSIEGAKRRGLHELPSDQKHIYSERLRKELKLIQSKNFSDYFLIVADIVNWAKTNGILVGPARGSSAGSLLCYLIGITEIDPLKHDLVFERFLDETRYDLPDIDVDFPDKQRDEVKQYILQRYGEDKVCNLATFAAFKGRNSLDEVGKVFRIPQGSVNNIKKYLVARSGADMRADLTIQDTFEMSPEAQQTIEQYPDLKNAIALEGQLRHMSTHAAGIIIGDQPLNNIIGLYERDGKILSSVEMKDAAFLGLLKIDVLGITELSILSDVAQMIGWNVLDYYKIPLTDSETMRGFQEVDVEGIFQFEGDSTKSVLRQLPNLNDFEQLVACVTMSKPGPAHSGSTTRYISYARGDKKGGGLDWNPVLAEITQTTNYQIIYQEQVLRIVREIGDMTFSDANKIRGAMAKSQGEGVFEQYWDSFTKGAIANGLTPEQAKRVWGEIKTMGRWSFNKSHAVSYAMLAWWSMYVKRHFPLQFYLARLLHETDSLKKARLLREIRARKIEVLPPKLGKSNVMWAIEGGDSLRSGLMEIKGIGNKNAERLISSGARKKDDLLTTKKIKGVGVKAIEKLDQNGVFEDSAEVIDFFGLSKFDILDEIAPQRTKLVDIRDWDKGYDICVAGLFIEMNYKDIFEERRSRGLPTHNIRDPEIVKYAMMLLEDETDRCLVNVDRYLFNGIGQKVWEAYNEQQLVVINGIKIDGWRMVKAKTIQVNKG